MAKRDGFTSSFGVLAATLGSAVGLGNIWKFPYMIGANGGAGFLLIYLLATLLVGLPVMIAEITIGRQAKTNPITALQQMAPRGLPWWLIGVMGVISAFLIMAFYSEVVAWVFAYVPKAISGEILSSDPKVTGTAFSALISDPIPSLVWQWGVLLFIGSILLMGVSKGIEAVTKRLMPLLFILLIVLCAFSLSLEKSGEALQFLFKPDFSKINGTVLLAAMGLAFFKLSVGMATMMTYGSYFRDDQDVPVTAFRVMCADLFVSILAGIAIFPAVFTFGFQPEAGPPLVFITIPTVFSQMPLGHTLMVIFFLLTSVAAIGAMLSLLEVPVVVIHERFAISRKKATLITLLLVALLGSTCALTNSLMADFKVLGMTMFDLFDYLSSNILMPVGGILIALFVGWRWGYPALAQALSNQHQLHNQQLSKVLFWVLKFITPLLILIVMLHALQLF